MPTPASRILPANQQPVRQDGAYVLYWMTAARRTRWSFGLQRAAEQARSLGRPLLVLEALRCGHRWASQRIHHFVLPGMAANQRQLRAAGVQGLSYVERHPGEGQGLVEALARRACLVVTDHFPTFFLPQMVGALAPRLAVRLEAVDGNGLFPLADFDRPFPTAAGFRRAWQRLLLEGLPQLPLADPLRLVEGMPLAQIADLPWRWSTPEALEDLHVLEGIPLDAEVGPGALPGGEPAAHARMRAFLDSRLPRYAVARSHPDDPAASGLSPYLHFGHLSAAELVSQVWDRDGWDPGSLPPRATGSRAGFWGLSEAAESFLDQLITRRELGFGFAHHRPDDHHRYAGLPDWARTTLAEHALDPRPHRYSRSQLETAETHDPVWNAAQRELRATGGMNDYLRMLWGKKVLEWSASPEEAFDTLVELNNRWAIDGRDPNSYSGISWTFGRFDRAWGPVRPIFGKIRYMSSENTVRKLPLADWLARWGGSWTTGAAPHPLP